MSTQLTQPGKTSVTGTHRKWANKTSIAGALKRSRDETYIENGDPICKKKRSQDQQHEMDRKLGLVTPLPRSVCGISPPNHHTPVDNCQSASLMHLIKSVRKPSKIGTLTRPQKPNTPPPGLERHPSNTLTTPAWIMIRILTCPSMHRMIPLMMTHIQPLPLNKSRS